MTEYRREDDYTLLVTNDLPTGGKLCRFFNFAAGQVTIIFTQRADLKDGGTYSSNPVAVSTALTSRMETKNFSAFDSSGEIELMHAKLTKMGGNPPPLGESLTGKLDKPRPGLSQ